MNAVELAKRRLLHAAVVYADDPTPVSMEELCAAARAFVETERLELDAALAAKLEELKRS